MTILAVYYTLADIVLLLQCFYYKGFTLRDDFKKPMDESDEDSEASEQSPLLPHRRPQSSGSPYTNGNGNGIEVQRPRISDIDRRGSSHSQGSFRERYLSIDGTFRLSHRSTITLLLHTRMARSQPNLSRPSPAYKQSSSTLVPSFLYARPESSVGISVPGTPPPPISQMTRTRHPNQHCTSTFGARSPATFAPHSTLALVSHSSCLTTAASLPRASACYFSCLLA